MLALTVEIESATDLHLLAPAQPQEDLSGRPDEAWLSYQYIGKLVQTKRFRLIQGAGNFAPSSKTFRIDGSTDKLNSFFAAEATGFLLVYACTQGAVRGRARVNLKSLLSLENICDLNFTERSGRGEFIFRDCNANEDVAPPMSFPRISVKAQLKRAVATNSSSTSCSTVASQTLSAPIKNSLPNGVKEEGLTEQRAAHPLSVLQHPPISEQKLAFEKEKRKWEEWRHKQVIQWQEQVRKKEAETIKSLEERSEAKEIERRQAAEASRQDFLKLEARLRKGLVEVEKRERRIRTVEASREADYTTKMGQIELKERLVKEETRHAAELERLKVKAALERASDAEKATAATQERIKDLEGSFLKYKKSLSETPEALLRQEIATLKGQMAASEVSINKEISEKNRALFEKEQCRSNLEKLGRALKRERQKVANFEEKELKQLRLQYAAKPNGSSFAIAGNRDDLHRIKNELRSLCSNTCNTPPAAIEGPVRIHSRQKHSPGEIPTPLTPPKRPSPTSIAATNPPA